MRNTPVLIGACLLLSPFAAAQGRGIGALYTTNLPGDVVLPPGSLNIGVTINATNGTPSTWLTNLQTGVARLPNGHYIISSDDADDGNGTGTDTNVFYEIDSAGTVVATIAQPNGPPQNDPRGLQDLAWDHDTGPDSRIWSGTDGSAIFSFDWHTGNFDPLVNLDVNSVHGTKILDGWEGNSIFCAAVVDIGGQQVLVTADTLNPDLVNPPGNGFTLGSPTNWHSIEPPIVSGSFTNFRKFRDTTLDPTDGDINLNPGPQDAGKFGLAYDPVHQTLWYAVDEQFANPNPNGSSARFIEMDLDGNRTGKVYQGVRQIAGAIRGCEMYVDANGDLVMVYIAAFLNEVLVEVHGGFDFGGSCGGDIGWENEPFVGNLDAFNITLENASANAAFLFRGPPVAAPGVSIPDITNCGILLSLGNFRNVATSVVSGGAASFNQVLPDDQSLVGIEIGYQWLMPSPVGGLPLDLSAAGVIRIGENQ